MNSSVRLFLTTALAFAPGFESLALTPPPEIPVETLFQTATISALEFSPDGTKILCLVPYQRRANLAVIDLQKGAKNLLSNFKDKEAVGPFWASNDRILFGVDDNGKEQYQIYAVNPDGSNNVVLPFNTRVRLVRRLPEDPKNFLVYAGITFSDWWDVAFMNLRTGILSSPIARAPGDVDYYVIDHKNVVRFAVVDDRQTRRVLYRDANKTDWREIASHHVDAEGWEPIAFDGDNRTVYAWSNIGRKTRAVHRYDTGTKTLSDVVFGDETYDVDDVIYDESRKKIVGLRYQADRLRFHWLDQEMAAIHARIEKSLPNTVHYPIQFSEDGTKIIFLSYSDRDPGVYYLYDRRRQQLSELAVALPKIDPEQMASQKPIRFQARDGLSLHGYLTLPVGRDPKNLPLIIHPHGGPFGVRDVWGYDPEVQFYANRGFAVLQVNYRGSGGYGDAFEAAGFKKWGLEMQDDLTDAVKWAVAQGVADPARVVISGASYGGYATMAGLVFTPDLYCAGINYVGVVDIDGVIPKAQPPDRRYWYNTRIGNLGNAADRKRIHDTSPVNFADRIRVPLLMAYGRNDPRVRVDQAYDIQSAMKKTGKPFELVIEDDEGHGFHTEEKRIAFYGRIDRFLRDAVPGMKGTTKLGPLEVLPEKAKGANN